MRFFLKKSPPPPRQCWSVFLSFRASLLRIPLFLIRTQTRQPAGNTHRQRERFPSSACQDRGGERQTDRRTEEGKTDGQPGFSSREAPSASVQHGQPPPPPPRRPRAIPLQGPAGAAQSWNGHVPANHLWCRYIKQKKKKKGGGVLTFTHDA